MTTRSPQVGEANAELQKVTQLMVKITHKGQTVPIKGELDPTKLLPGKWTAAFNCVLIKNDVSLNYV